ncbi:hypothetical protein D3C84_896090 [compost metagenome]
MPHTSTVVLSESRSHLETAGGLIRPHVGVQAIVGDSHLHTSTGTKELQGGNDVTLEKLHALGFETVTIKTLRRFFWIALCTREQAAWGADHLEQTLVIGFLIGRGSYPTEVDIAG